MGASADGEGEKKKGTISIWNDRKTAGNATSQTFCIQPPPPAAQNNKAYKTRTITVPIMQNAPPDIFPIHKKKVSV